MCVGRDVLAYLQVRHIDFLSLDVEGGELSVLQTLDFNQASCRHKRCVDAAMLTLLSPFEEGVCGLRISCRKPSCYNQT